MNKISSIEIRQINKHSSTITLLEKLWKLHSQQYIIKNIYTYIRKNFSIENFTRPTTNSFLFVPSSANSRGKERERKRRRERLAGERRVRQLSPILRHCRAMFWVFPNTGEHPVLSCSRRSNDYAHRDTNLICIPPPSTPGRGCASTTETTRPHSSGTEEEGLEYHSTRI